MQLYILNPFPVLHSTYEVHDVSILVFPRYILFGLVFTV